MKNLTPYGCCLLLVSLLLQPVLTAQEAEEGERRDLFFESVDVNLVNVDVFVTDDKGNRVTDLLPSDFEVFEDGRPVEVTNFYVVEDRKYKRGMPAALPAPAVEIDASAPSGSVEASPPLLEDVDIVPDSQRLSVILFIDNLNIRPFDRNKVMREMNRFLHERVSRDDQVMVVSFERTTHVRQSFTNDIRLVMDALKGRERSAEEKPETAKLSPPGLLPTGSRLNFLRNGVFTVEELVPMISLLLTLKTVLSTLSEDERFLA